MSGRAAVSRGADPEVRDRAAAGDAVALTQALVAIPSVNPRLEEGGSGEADVASQSARWLAQWGFAVTTPEPEPGRPNVLARHAGDRPGPVLLLNGHLDTVGVAGMTVPPWEGVLSEGRIAGRGACDMKGGVAALLAAARRVADEGHAGELVVALTCDEEHASVGMSSLVAGGLRADAAVVCEPTGLAIMSAHKGFVWVEATFEGRAAHGSRPEVGIDAIRHAARFLVGLEALDERLTSAPAHPLLGHGSLHAGTIAGGTAASVYPERCSVVLERRTLPGETSAQVLAELGEVLDRVRAAVPGLQAELRLDLVRPGTEIGPEHALVRGLADAAEGRDLPARIEGMTAWVDAAFLNEAGIPAVCFGPGSIAQAHSADEWIDAAEIPLCADVLADFARRFLG
jgi:acetylornithine deacetylase